LLSIRTARIALGDPESAIHKLRKQAIQPIT
jgi:hypothetical protein